MKTLYEYKLSNVYGGLKQNDKQEIFIELGFLKDHDSTQWITLTLKEALSESNIFFAEDEGEDNGRKTTTFKGHDITHRTAEQICKVVEELYVNYEADVIIADGYLDENFMAKFD